MSPPRLATGMDESTLQEGEGDTVIEGVTCRARTSASRVVVIGRLWVNLRWTCSKRLVTCGLMNAGGSPHTGSAAYTSALCASSGCPQKATGYDPSLSGRVLPHQAWSPYTRIAKCGISDSLFLQTMWASRKDGIVQDLLTWTFHLVCIYVFGLTRGKTSVVAHFTGEGAKEERARLQFAQTGGEWIQTQSTDQSWLHYVPTYKHLGTVFCASLTLDHEVRTRIGMAYSAFQCISGTVLCNRRLPVAVRLKLFRALVLSKLYYGAGAWSPLTATTLKRLRSAIVKMLRRILGSASPTTEWETTTATFGRAQLLEPEAYIALERLRFAASLYRFGWDELHMMLVAEDEAVQDSWLGGLREAVQLPMVQ